LTRKSKENNMIPLRDWNSYLKNIYQSPNFVDNIQTVFIEEKVFSIEYVEFGIKQLTKGKSRNIEGYQEEILKIRGDLSSSLTSTSSSI
jgi:hypothetical protein